MQGKEMSDSVNFTTDVVSFDSAINATQFVMPPLVLGIRYACIPVWIILLFFGIFGNTLTFFVLRAKRLQQSSTSFYLTALAITDMLYLLTSLVASIANFIFFFPSELRQLTHTFCVLIPFVTYTLAYISVWLLVAVTVERAVWVVLPFRARHICTKRAAKFVVGLLVTGFALLDIHFFVTMQYQEARPGYWACETTFFSFKVFPFLDLLLVAILPCIIMLVANCLIGWKLRVMLKFRSGTAVIVMNNVKEQGGSDKREKSANLTRMLVSTNVFFIVSVTPLLIYDVVYFTVDLRAWAEEEEELRGAIIFAIERFVYTLWYTNFAIHFLLYCLSGPPFRAEVLALFNRLRDHLRSTNQKHLVDQTKLQRSTIGPTSTAITTSIVRDTPCRVELL